MTEYALVGPLDEIKEYRSDVDPSAGTKPGWRWLPVVVTDPSVNPATQIKEGPTVTVELEQVTRVFTVRAKTTQELDADKDAAVSTLNGSTYTPQLKILLEIVNDARAAKAKLNALIDATGQSGTVTKYPAGQVSQINMTQLKAAIKALL